MSSFDTTAAGSTRSSTGAESPSQIFNSSTLLSSSSVLSSSNIDQFNLSTSTSSTKVTNILRKNEELQRELINAEKLLFQSIEEREKSESEKKKIMSNLQLAQLEISKWKDVAEETNYVLSDENNVKDEELSLIHISEPTRPY